MRTLGFNLLGLLLLSWVSIGYGMPAQDPDRPKFVVVLDAGHGGKDPGNRGNGYFEKDIALNIVLEVGKELEKHPDVKVLYTRKSDVFVTLAERAAIANDAAADLFVSVHANSHSSQASGTETFVLGLRRNADNMEVAKRENRVIYLEEDYEITYSGFDPDSPESHIGLTLMQEEYLDQSILLADYIQKNFTEDLKRKNRGVKQDVFLVLRETYMPSVLVEAGFLTNKSEGAYLNSSRGQKEISRAIVQAVVDYKNNINLDLAAGLPTAQDHADNGIVFKVQIAASQSAVELQPYNFKGLRDLSRNREAGLYKYYYGETSSYPHAQELLKKAKDQGFPSSFVVAFKDGEKIDVQEALETKVN